MKLLKPNPDGLIEVSTSSSFDSLSAESSTDTSDTAGTHLILDFWGGNGLEDCTRLEKALTKAARIAGAVLLHIHLHKFNEGGGVTGVALLAESHISVHTWPEHGYAAFDIFMCGNAQPEKAAAYLEAEFTPTKTSLRKILRGEGLSLEPE